MTDTTTQKEKRKPGRPCGSNAKEIVLNHAWKAFILHGYHECTVAHILEAANVSRTNFYRFFQNKEQVFEHLMDRSFKELRNVMQQAFKHASTLENVDDHLEHVLKMYLQSCFAAGDLLPIAFQEQQSTLYCRKLREDAVIYFRDNILNIIEKHGYKNIDLMLLEAVLAGIDRIVLLQAKKSGTDEKSLKSALKLCLNFASPTLKHYEQNRQ